jgi:serine/threonine protein kinase
VGPGREIPTSLLHYRVLSKLGEGGMGAVYKAEDTKLGRTVAIKVMATARGEEDSARQRLLREARGFIPFPAREAAVWNPHAKTPRAELKRKRIRNQRRRDRSCCHSKTAASGS